MYTSANCEMVSGYEPSRRCTNSSNSLRPLLDLSGWCRAREESHKLASMVGNRGRGTGICGRGWSVWHSGSRSQKCRQTSGADHVSDLSGFAARAISHGRSGHAWQRIGSNGRIARRVFSGVRGYSCTFSRGGLLPLAAQKLRPMRNSINKIDHYHSSRVLATEKLRSHWSIGKNPDCTHRHGKRQRKSTKM